jgi:hypothetical protein
MPCTLCFRSIFKKISFTAKSPRRKKIRGSLRLCAFAVKETFVFMKTALILSFLRSDRIIEIDFRRVRAVRSIGGIQRIDQCLPLLHFRVGTDHVFFLRFGRMLEHLVFCKLYPFFSCHGRGINEFIAKIVNLQSEGRRFVKSLLPVTLIPFFSRR